MGSVVTDFKFEFQHVDLPLPLVNAGLLSRAAGRLHSVTHYPLTAGRR